MTNGWLMYAVKYAHNHTQREVSVVMLDDCEHEDHTGERRMKTPTVHDGAHGQGEEADLKVLDEREPAPLPTYSVNTNNQ